MADPSGAPEAQRLCPPQNGGAEAAYGQYDPELAQHGGECDKKFAFGQVTVRLPLDWRPLPLLALALSFLPWLIPAALVADIVCTRRLSSIALLALLVTCSAVTELLLKPLVQQARPSTTACRDSEGRVLPGMPSGHVVTSQVLGVWYSLQACWELPPEDAAWIVPLLIAFMATVPWARWYNGDHTLMQVLVAAVFGTFCGAGAYAAYHCCAPSAWIHQSGGGLPDKNASLTEIAPSLHALHGLALARRSSALQT
mmetsp:Transcript_99004/g.288715  ORF Transcript_99004/g.288715 Transcript_99004/m.288715 type:complete len:255 (+) Transcript_99004:48-812(+)